MTLWEGEMEFEVVPGDEGRGSLVATRRVISVLRNYLANNDIASAARLYEEHGTPVINELMEGQG